MSLSFLAVMGLAFWAYRENYADAGRAERRVQTCKHEIADLREALTVQRAEWAYLNRPDRLRELADDQLRPAGPVAAGTRPVRRERRRWPIRRCLKLSRTIDQSGRRRSATSRRPTRDPHPAAPAGPHSARPRRAAKTPTRSSAKTCACATRRCATGRAAGPRGGF